MNWALTKDPEWLLKSDWPFDPVNSTSSIINDAYLIIDHTWCYFLNCNPVKEKY